MAADVHGGKAVHGHAAIALDPSAEIVWYLIVWRPKVKLFQITFYLILKNFSAI